MPCEGFWRSNVTAPRRSRISSHEQLSFDMPGASWTPEQDAFITKQIEGTESRQWTSIGVHIGKTGKQVRERYLGVLDPTLMRQAPWTAAEDAKLSEAGQRHPSQWAYIRATYFPLRSESDIKNRAKSTAHKKTTSTQLPFFPPSPSPSPTVEFHTPFTSPNAMMQSEYRFLCNTTAPTSSTVDNDMIICGTSSSSFDLLCDAATRGLLLGVDQMNTSPNTSSKWSAFPLS